MSKTEQHLKEAFAGESQANRKYLAFAAQADRDGHPAVSRLFRAQRTPKPFMRTPTCAYSAASATQREPARSRQRRNPRVREDVPRMIADADAEGNAAAARSFRLANAVEKIHAALYRKALAGLGSDADMTYWVCEVCGNTVENEAPRPARSAGPSARRSRKVG